MILEALEKKTIRKR